MTEKTLHLAVALDGLGWHPAAWRSPAPRAGAADRPLLGGPRREAERAALDLVTIEDGLDLQSTRPDGPDGRADQVRGRLDAVLVAARLAPLTRHIGLVPTTSVTHTEPFHLSTAVATLDHVSGGRAGWRPRVSARAAEAGHFGRRDIPAPGPGPARRPEAVRLVGDLLAEAGDAVEVVRRLWDSWQDDAEIRDVATGRFVDREKLHYIDFVGRWFSRQGPLHRPRSPQGQPVVAALAHSSVPYASPPGAPTSASSPRATPRRAPRSSPRSVPRRRPPGGRDAGRCTSFGRPGASSSTSRRRAPAGAGPSRRAGGRRTYRSTRPVFTGTPADLADLLAGPGGRRAGRFPAAARGTPPRPDRITRALVPELRGRGAFREDIRGGDPARPARPARTG